MHGGTRVDILSQLLAWATNDTSQPIYWLNGMAGTGKIAIAKTFCEHLQALNNHLGASFFLSRALNFRNHNGRTPETIVDDCTAQCNVLHFRQTLSDCWIAD
jgi:chloramphenicol 3-O-phosphotransferase